MNNEVVAVLEEMDNLFSGPEKWTKNRFKATVNEIDCYCLEGALILSLAKVNGIEFVWPVDKERNCTLVPEFLLTRTGLFATKLWVEGLISKLFPFRAMISTYNDSPETTFEDIKNLLAKSLEIARKEA